MFLPGIPGGTLTVAEDSDGDGFDDDTGEYVGDGSDDGSGDDGTDESYDPDYDSDGDGLSDEQEWMGVEVEVAYEPFYYDETTGEEVAHTGYTMDWVYPDPEDADSDDDLLPDGLEVLIGFNPMDAADGNCDSDGDGLSYGREYLENTNPDLRDSDGDGFEDGDEVLVLLTDPNDPSDPLLDDGSGDEEVDDGGGNTGTGTEEVDPDDDETGDDGGGSGDTGTDDDGGTGDGGSDAEGGVDDDNGVDGGEDTEDEEQQPPGSNEVWLEIRGARFSSGGPGQEQGSDDDEDPGEPADENGDGGTPPSGGVGGFGLVEQIGGPAINNDFATHSAVVAAYRNMLTTVTSDSGSLPSHTGREGGWHPMANNPDQSFNGLLYKAQESYEQEGSLGPYLAFSEEVQVRLAMAPGRTAEQAIKRSFLKVTRGNDEDEDGENDIIEVEVVELEIAEGQEATAQGGVITLKPETSIPSVDGMDGSRASIGLLPMEVRDISDNTIVSDKAWIKAHKSDTDPKPQMPKLEASIPGLANNLTVEWRLEIEYDRRSGRDDMRIPAGPTEEPGLSTQGGEPWKIWEELPLRPDYEFVGGDCTLKYEILGSGSGNNSGEIKFRILDENPDDDRCKAYITSKQGTVWYAWAVAQHESGDSTGAIFNQFANGRLDGLPGGAHGDKGEPFYANDGSEGDGWGMFQRDSSSGHPVTTLETWSWEENMEGFLDDEYPEHLAIAKSYIDYIKANNPNTFENPEFTIKGRSISGLHVLALTWYNSIRGTSSQRMPFDGSKPAGQRWLLNLPNAPEKDQPYVDEVLDEYNEGTDYI